MKPLLVLLMLVTSLPAWASGFYLPWWGEALFFLLVTPMGWVCVALLLVVLVVLVILAVKRWAREGST
ncbi:MAG: hypothetical protein J7556_15165 [Acidovorax sp.]|nr:hypothetical protein [Acidovorax sp.]